MWKKVITVRNAQGAFRETGLFPLNTTAIPDHIFDLSTTTERELLPENEVSTEQQVDCSGSSSPFA